MFAAISKDLRKTALFIMTAVVAVGCGSEGVSKKHEAETSDTAWITQDTSVMYESAKSIFYSMPSPLELTTLIKNAGGDFRKEMLANPNMAAQYQSNSKKAMMLGVYADYKSYALVYGQQGEAIKFLAACKRVGESIGVHEAFTAELLERANANMSDRDSMLNIMTEMYWNTSSQLREESRDQIALLAMSAGWVEGIYLGCALLNPDNPDPDIAKRIAEQKFASAQLKDIYDSHIDADPLVDEVRPLITPLFEFFESLVSTIETPNSVKKNASGVTTIGGKQTIAFSKEQMAHLKKLSAEIRQKITTP